MVDNENDLKEIKVILLGESGVGKTCIINRYVHNLFSPEVESTLGSSFLCKEIIKDNIKYKLKKIYVSKFIFRKYVTNSNKSIIINEHNIIF